MWKVPASPKFIKDLSIAGVLPTVPEYEQVYLGRQLTRPNSLAKKVSVDPNTLRFLPVYTLQKRAFYFQASSNEWFVKVDGT